MRKSTIISFFLIAMLSCPCAFAWSEKDVMWESAFMAASLADNQQVLAGTGNCSLDTTGADFSGMSANLACLNTAVLTSVAIHAGIASVLPAKYRRMFQQGSVSFDMQQSEPITRVAVSLAF